MRYSRQAPGKVTQAKSVCGGRGEEQRKKKPAEASQRKHKTRKKKIQK